MCKAVLSTSADLKYLVVLETPREEKIFSQLGNIPQEYNNIDSAMIVTRLIDKLSKMSEDDYANLCSLVLRKDLTTDEAKNVKIADLIKAATNAYNLYIYLGFRHVRM